MTENAPVPTDQPLPLDHSTAQDAPTNVQQSSDEDRTADMLSILNEMDTEGGEPQALTQRDSQAQDTPKPSSEPVAQAPDTDLDPQEVDRAREAMQRVLGKEMFAKVQEGLSDQEILDRGSVLAKQQADQQRAYNESQELKQQIDELVQQKVSELTQNQNQDGAPPQPGDAPQPQDTELSQVVSETVDKVFEESDAYVDEDIKGTMRQAMVQLAATLEQRFEMRTGQAAEQQAAAMNALNLQRDRLEMQQIATDPAFQKEFPDIRNPEQFEMVASTVYKLAQTDPDRTEYFDQGGNPRFDRLMRHAASMVMSRNNPQKQAQVDLVRKQRKAGGSQPITGTSHGQPAAPVPTEATRKASMMDIYDQLDAKS